MKFWFKVVGIFLCFFMLGLFGFDDDFVDKVVVFLKNTDDIR